MIERGAAWPSYEDECEESPSSVGEYREKAFFSSSAEALSRRMMEPRPTAVAAIVYSIWFAVVGLILALVCDSSPWREIGFALLIVFGACAATGLVNLAPGLLRAHRRSRRLSAGRA